MKLILILLQIAVLTVAIVWRQKREREAPLRRALRLPRNGVARGALFTPAHGTRYEEQP